MLNMRSTLQTAQLNERYTALLNKNLENTTNLAKAMRNNKINVCDKLKNSHQNAN